MQHVLRFWRYRKVLAVILLALVLLLLQRLLAPRERVTIIAQAGGVSGSRAPATTQTTEAEHSVGVDGVQLFLPDEKSDWGLPAELATSELSDAVRRLDQVEREFARACERRKAYRGAIVWLLSEPVRAALWARLVQGGFRDKRLPLDWYSMIEHEYGLLDEVVHGLRDEAALGMAMYVTALRLKGAEVRLLGGKPVVGDMLFIRVLEQYARSQNAYFDECEPKVMRIRARLGSEFPQRNQ